MKREREDSNSKERERVGEKENWSEKKRLEYKPKIKPKWGD